MPVIIPDDFRTQKTFGFSPGEGATYFQDSLVKKAGQGRSPEMRLRFRLPSSPFISAEKML